MMVDMEDTPEMVIRRRKLAKEEVDAEESELEDSAESKPLVSPGLPDTPVRKTSRGNRSVKLEEPLEIDVGEGPSENSEEENAEGTSKEEPVGFFDFVWRELTRGYNLQNDSNRYSEKTRKVCAFLWIPYELECFLFFGFLQCVDAFCHLLTFLPIRLLMAFIGFCTGRKSWTPAVTCDFIKLLIVVSTAFLMQYFVDTSMIYHLVRGQSVIKLYICYNMLEVADKLFSSFGQDILDSCFWRAVEKPVSIWRFALHFAGSILYAFLHSILVLLQATCLNVAFNSQNQALLAIMLSNNFVELKGSVFKKLGKPNLFQMSCSDVRERFHILVLLVVVVMRNMMAVNWNFEHLIEMFPDLVCVICGELIVDWLKHAFITKFNEINAKVYEDFTTTIAFDVVRGHEEGAYSDYSDQVSRRMGFIPIPLTVVLIRVIGQSINMEGRVTVFLFALTWIVVLTVKILNGILIYGQACNHVKRYRNLQAQEEYEIYRKRMLLKKSKSAPNSPRMSLIDFSDVLHQPRPSKGFTISDVITHWEELSQSAAEIGDREERKEPSLVEVLLGPEPPSPAPRRTQSMIFVQNRSRDKSLPPSTTIPEGDERSHEDSIEPQKESISQTSPKRKVPTIECESLTDIQAYTMLGKEADGIQS
uniref:Protein TAPT1 homolog n=1 Tax=Steinernema glaseri TaxID=37863 RepID=A0A1I8A828_9BILA